MESHSENWQKYFYITVLTIAALLTFFGFSFSFQEVFVDPHHHTPFIIYLHAVIASLWLLLMIGQAALVRRHNVMLHRRIGIWAGVLGVAFFVVSVLTSIILRKLSIEAHGLPMEPKRLAFLAIPLRGTLMFGIYLGLALWWRRKPEIHRRLMVLLVCDLITPGLARLPDSFAIPAIPIELPLLIPGLLLVVAICFDIFFKKRLPVVYGLGLVSFAASNAVAAYLFLNAPAAWMAVAGFLVL